MKDQMIDKAQKRKAQAEMFEHSYLEWNLLRSLAFAERDWILICAALFMLSDTREFLTVAGFICMGLGIFFLAPVYGFFLHLVGKRIYRHGKARGVMPKTVAAAKKITWQANAYVFPVMLVVSWLAVDLYYDGYHSLAQWTNTPALPQQQQAIRPAQTSAIEPIAPVTPVAPLSPAAPAESAPIVSPAPRGGSGGGSSVVAPP